MSPTKTTASGRRSSVGKRLTGNEPAALKRLNRSLDTAQDALVALRKDVGKDVSTGSRALYRDLEKFIRDARRDSGKLGRALQHDVERVQKRLSSRPAKTASRDGARRKPAASSTSKPRTTRRTSRSA